MTEIIYPGTFSQALNSNLLLPGSKLLLHGGTYKGDFVSNLSNVTIQPYGNEKPVIDGSFTINGSGVIVKDLEIYYSGWTSRITEQSGSSPTDIPYKPFMCNAPNSKIINCVIHDLSISSFAGEGSEISGCVIYNIGWKGSDRGHGHGLYPQNETSTKIIKDNILFNNFGFGLHAYSGSLTGFISNMQVVGNTIFCSGSLSDAMYPNILFGGASVADAIALNENMTYSGVGNTISYGNGSSNVALTDNYFQDGLDRSVASISSESGNYYGSQIGNNVLVRQNAYKTDRANVTIYNEAEADNIAVDLSSVSGLSIGDTVTLKNVQDYFVDIQTLTLDAEKKITVNMQASNRTVTTPIQWTPPITTFPKFGCFVVQK